MFDATRMSPLDELIRIAIGRDAKDVAFATIFGPAMMVSMSPLIEKVGAAANVNENALPNSSSSVTVTAQ
jgi:hypothetical protein